MSGSVTWEQSLSGTRAVPTLLGDTIERIALRETGDAANWYRLVAINGLDWPYITDDADPAAPGTILLAGQDPIKVPAPPPPATGVADPTDVFGIDIYLEQGVIQITAAGDFATVAGPANLDQAVTNRLSTRPAELVYHPDYGNRLYQLLAQPNNGGTDDLAAVFLARCIGADPRISSVPLVNAQVSGGSCVLTATAVAIDGKRLPVGSTISGSP